MNHFFEVLARALEYPGEEDWASRLQSCKQWADIQEPEIAMRFGRYFRRVEAISIEKLQELYTQTFDLNPLCTLDIGYHLFGENYKRGELLAKLRETEAPYELGQANQLPDHLPVLLRLLTEMQDEELRSAMIRELMIPALDTMSDALSKNDNPYSDLIEVVSGVLKNEAPSGNGSLSVGAVDMPALYRISSRAVR